MENQLSVPALRPRRRLPKRYRGDSKQPFLDRDRSEMQPGLAILDAGSGRRAVSEPRP